MKRAPWCRGAGVDGPQQGKPPPPGFRVSGGGSMVRSGKTTATEAKTPRCGFTTATSAAQMGSCARMARSPRIEVKTRKTEVCKQFDKEKLIEEIMQLRAAAADQAYHLKLHIEHHLGVQEENKELCTRVEQLEERGSFDAPRTGGRVRLLARISGLSKKAEELEQLINSQGSSIALLRVDPLVTATAEARTERDIFAYEIRRLQKMVRTVRADYAKVTREIHEVQDLDDNIRLLEARNTAIKGPITAAKKQIESIKKSLQECKAFLKECDDKKMHAVDRLKHLENLEKSLQKQLMAEHTQRQTIQQQIIVVTTQIGEENRAAARKRRFPNESDNG